MHVRNGIFRISKLTSKLFNLFQCLFTVLYTADLKTYLGSVPTDQYWCVLVYYVTVPAPTKPSHQYHDLQACTRLASHIKHLNSASLWPGIVLRWKYCCSIFWNIYIDIYVSTCNHTYSMDDIYDWVTHCPYFMCTRPLWTHLSLAIYLSILFISIHAHVTHYCRMWPPPWRIAPGCPGPAPSPWRRHRTAPPASPTPLGAPAAWGGPV